MTRALVIGVDVGGTFTDIFALDRITGEVRTAKVPSTPADQSEGFVNGIAQVAASFADIATVVHGTTVATNALLESKGAPTGLITTEGFRDVLEMRRRDRPKTWGLDGTFTPVVARDRRVEVAERTLADGTTRTAVDPAEVAARAKELEALGVEAVCVFFINGYANARNERTAVAAVREVWPNPFVTAATEILPEIREFERLSTAALNAYLQPVVARYLDRLRGRLQERGGPGDILIVQSNGGLMDLDAAKRYPVRTALSGPAAGVIAATTIATAAGFPNIITCDMGGTSFDVALVADGRSTLTAQASIGFGKVVRTPMVEITTIGAGGGSIARVDASGLLEVGPESAGSDPGPVAYGLGNARPTVTDANVVLGRINAERPIGGKLARLDVAAAEAAIRREVAAPLGLDVTAAAEAILEVANAKMAGAIRLVSIERGHDPATFAAMPFGGGGALHAGALIKEVGLDAALVPRFPGVTSALGCIVADLRFDRVQTVNALVDEVDVAELARTMRAIAAELRAQLDAGDTSIDEVVVEVAFDMHYVGQTHTVSAPLAVGPDDLSTEAIREAFDSAYVKAFGRLLDRVPERIQNLKVTVVGKRPTFDPMVLAPLDGEGADGARLGARRVHALGQWHLTPVYDRLRLAVGTVVPGPAVLEQADTTIFVDPDLEGRVDAFGNLVITRCRS